MSRNEEKAKATLNRWKQFSATNAAGGSSNEGYTKKRRKLASECNSLAECEQTRRELVQQITSKLEQIQTVVPDDNCKRLNDEINKLFSIKFMWERQIRALGGPDYRQDKDNKHAREYMYFGAAKELPEVKALFKKKEADLLSNVTTTSAPTLPVDPSRLSHIYYGLGDSDLTSLEAEAEVLARKATVEEFGPVASSHVSGPDWSEKWRVPTKEEVDQALLDHRKEQLLRKYAI